MASRLTAFRVEKGTSCQVDGAFLNENPSGNWSRSSTFEMPRERHENGKGVKVCGISSPSCLRRGTTGRSWPWRRARPTSSPSSAIASYANGMSPGSTSPPIARLGRTVEMPAGYLGSAGRIGRLSDGDIAAIKAVLSEIAR